MSHATSKHKTVKHLSAVMRLTIHCCISIQYTRKRYVDNVVTATRNRK